MNIVVKINKLIIINAFFKILDYLCKLQKLSIKSASEGLLS